MSGPETGTLTRPGLEDFMRLPRRRVPPTRRLGRPGRPALPGRSAPPSANDTPTEVDLPSVLEDLPEPSTPEQRSQESTVEVPSVTAEIVVEPPPVAKAKPPAPPPRLEFDCDCGAPQVATPATYDQNHRCTECRATMLLSLVYDGDRRCYEIAPFRVNPESGS